jgi:hypothetical protein
MGLFIQLGASEKVMRKEYDQFITHNEMLLTLLGSSEFLTINSTNLFNDVSKYSWSAAQHEEAAKLNQERFQITVKKHLKWELDLPNLSRNNKVITIFYFSSHLK